jgi:hypothetical protein
MQRSIPGTFCASYSCLTEYASIADRTVVMLYRITSVESWLVPHPALSRSRGSQIHGAPGAKDPLFFRTYG